MVIVDNDSGDGSFEALSAFVAKQDWPHVRVVASGHNGGFGAGNNVGIWAGRGDGQRADYVYFLNSDAFPAPDAVRLLVETLESHPNVGIAGSHIHGPEGDPHITAFRFPSIASEFEHAMRFGPVTRLLRENRVPMDLPLETAQVDWLAGASMMMRQDVIDQVGAFDETFFLYFEETDLCLRAARAGHTTIYVPESRVSHIGSVSTGMKTWVRIPGFWLDSRLHYFTKNHGSIYAGLATIVHAVGGLLYRARAVVQRKPRVDPAHFLRDLITHDLVAAFNKLTGNARAPKHLKPDTARRTS
jgi:GT2 family glycosyltransferase